MPKSNSKRRSGKIQDLLTHSAPYVTVSELAEYWRVSPKQIYKQIEARTLRAIRLGPRLMRIATPEAIEFERRANMRSELRDDETDTADVEVRQR